MKYGGKYWNIKKYLPYQRCFNFITSERTIGKTYTTQGFFLERAIEKEKEKFVYFVRNEDELKKHVFADAFEKVANVEFPEYKFTFKTDKAYLVEEPGFNEELEVTSVQIEPKLLGHAIALSAANKNKKRNFPFCKWGMLDEYIVDEKGTSTYVNGWNEPDLLLSLYHTIDREQDYFTIFLLANVIQFYNPYHLHPAFKIPKIDKGVIWKSENVLYHQAEATEELKEEKSKCKFLRMIQETQYGTYAKQGEFIHDNYNFLADRPDRARYKFTLLFKNTELAIWSHPSSPKLYIDESIDKSCKTRYALSYDDHDEDSVLSKRQSILLRNLALNFQKGRVYFKSMEVKAKAEDAIKFILGGK